MKKSTCHSTELSHCDKTSEIILLVKMGMSEREIREVYFKYGVTASRLLELKQLSKYQFVYSGKKDGQCEPCLTYGKIRAVNS